MSRQNMSKAEKEGRKIARSIVSTSDLMYQLNTKRNYLQGVLAVIYDGLNKMGKQVKNE